jgi:hypothetical protein
MKFGGFFVKKRWRVTWKTILNMTLNHKKIHYFTSYTQKFQWGKTHYSLRKRKKWQFLSTIEHEIMRLFVKNRWRVIWRTLLNMVWNSKNFSILHPVLKIEVKTQFLPAKTQKMIIFQYVRIWNFEVICEEQMTSHMMNNTKQHFKP